MKKILMASAAILLSACNGPAGDAPASPAAPAPQPEAAQPEKPEQSATPAPPAGAAAFAGKVWKVSASSTVDVGTTYAFRPDGQLVISSPTGTPLYGKWTYAEGALSQGVLSQGVLSQGTLSMIEEGITYPVDIIKLDANTFQIRMHTPAGTTDITLVPRLAIPTSPDQ